MYKGNKSCGIMTIEASVFIKRHWAFAILLMASSIFTMLSMVRLESYPVIWVFNHPNAAISGSTFSISLFTGITFLSNIEHYLPLSIPANKSVLATFYLCIAALSSLMTFITYYTPLAVSPLHSISTGIVLSNLLGTVYLLVSGKAISQKWIENLTILLCTLSTLVLYFLMFTGIPGSSEIIKKSKRLSASTSQIAINQISDVSEYLESNRSNKPLNI